MLHVSYGGELMMRHRVDIVSSSVVALLFYMAADDWWWL